MQRTRWQTAMLGAAALMGTASMAEDAREPSRLDTVVVTATRTDTPLGQLGQSVTVIDREQIDNGQFTTVTDLLRQTVGVDFRANGPHSSSTSLNLRGLQGYHTKLLINGIPLQDNAGVQQMPILNDINLDDVERIEIVRGPGSTIHGSNAIGGVVNIITRRGATATPQVSGNVEYGSHGRIRTAAGVRGASGPVDYAFSALRESERGISARTTPLNGDDDGWRLQQLQGSIGLALAENTRVELFGRYSESDEEYDMADAVWGPFTDSGDTHNQRWMGGVRFDATDLFDGLLDTTLSLSVADHRRGYRDNDGWSINDRFQGRSTDIHWQNTLHLHERVDLTLGIDRNHEEARVDDGGYAPWGIPPSVPVDDRHRTTAVFAALQTEPVDNLFLNGGVRWNNHSVFGYEWTYSAAAAYHLVDTGTRLKTSLGKSYRAPSLYELFEPLYGDPNLEPESGTSWDVGFEQDVCRDERIVFGSTYYRNRVTDYIGFDMTTWRYDQVSGIKTNGLESFIRLRPVRTVTVQFTHTYQHTNDMEAEASPLAFRPRHKGSADLNWRLLDDKLNMNVNGLYVGHQNTASGAGAHVDAYTLANAAIAYSFNEHFQVYLRAENLLNENYEVVPTYNTYGRTYYTGVNLRF